MLINLPTHQVKMFRAFARAEAVSVGARIEGKHRLLRWPYALFALTGAAITIYKYGRGLGLPIRTMQRIAAELEREGVDT